MLPDTRRFIVYCYRHIKATADQVQHEFTTGALSVVVKLVPSLIWSQDQDHYRRSTSWSSNGKVIS